LGVRNAKKEDPVVMQAESPRLIKAKLNEVHPTQLTVGFATVDAKVQKWKGMSATKREAYLSECCIPAIRAPDGEFYIVDHHHLGLALLKSQIKHARILLLKDLSSLRAEDFWMAMDHYNWVHPYNAKGRREKFSAIPTKLIDLSDDPYRSLVDEVHQQGGFATTAMLYAEFLWADYFRQRLKIQKNAAWSSTLTDAMVLAKHSDAKALPGWCGVDTM
jgi:hypothetical protein